MKRGSYKLTPIQVEKGIDEYLKTCKDNNKVPLITELCLKLDISNAALCDYRNNKLFEKSIKRLDKEQETAILRKGLDENKPVFPIFLLKSKFGYQESSKLDITSNGQSLGVVQLPSRE